MSLKGPRHTQALDFRVWGSCPPRPTSKTLRSVQAAVCEFRSNAALLPRLPPQLLTLHVLLATDQEMNWPLRGTGDPRGTLPSCSGFVEPLQPETEFLALAWLSSQPTEDQEDLAKL